MVIPRSAVVVNGCCLLVPGCAIGALGLLTPEPDGGFPTEVAAHLAIALRVAAVVWCGVLLFLGIRYVVVTLRWSLEVTMQGLTLCSGWRKCESLSFGDVVDVSATDFRAKDNVFFVLVWGNRDRPFVRVNNKLRGCRELCERLELVRPDLMVYFPKQRYMH